MLRKLLKALGYLVLAFVLYIVGFLIFGTLTDWQPEGTTALVESNGQTSTQPVINDSIVRLMTWNVGYGGIGDKDFFFYNQAAGFWWTKPGTVRMSEERVKSNVIGQEITLKSNVADIYLLQEVDTAARRSHYINQLAVARDARPDYSAHFAANFKSKRVPLPIFQPWDHYGYVVGGLASLSRYQPTSAERIQLPGEYAWPTNIFQLDRCALRQYWFSMNPTVRTTQLPFAIDFEFMPAGWQYAYDPTVASNRSSAAPYNQYKTRRKVIDFFLLSPNLRIKKVQGIEQEFRYSDHQPVYVEVELL